jgi:hypothetical protein
MGESGGDVATETIGRLRAFEESSKGRRDKEAEHRTRAKWEAKVAEEKRSAGGSSGGGKKKYRDKFDKSKINCRKCGELRHFADECDAVKTMSKAMAQLAVAGGDDEPTLL